MHLTSEDAMALFEQIGIAGAQLELAARLVHERDLTLPLTQMFRDTLVAHLTVASQAFCATAMKLSDIQDRAVDGAGCAYLASEANGSPAPTETREERP